MFTESDAPATIVKAIEFYAGAGGFSAAFHKAARSLGLVGQLLLAVNHNAEAIRTHRANFPETEHRLAAVERLAMAELADAHLLFGSPECRWQTVAKGEPLSHQRSRHQPGLPGLWTDDHQMSEAERSRASMWQMEEAVRAKMRQRRPFQAVLVENVVEAATRWADHADWVKQFQALGYRYRGLFLNARFFGVPQNRDRYFAVFWLATLPEPDLEFRPPAWCRGCAQEIAAIQCWKPGKRMGKYGSHYAYHCPLCGRPVIPFFRPAASFLDFSNRGERIGNRKRPLCLTTRQRIIEGLHRFRDGQPIPPEATHIPPDLPSPLPFLVKYNSNGKAESIFQPLGTVSSKDRYGLVFPPQGYLKGAASLEECTFRMLTPHEVQDAMGMQDLVIASPDKKEIVRQCGLAVPPPLAQAILLRLLSILS